MNGRNEFGCLRCPPINSNERFSPSLTITVIDTQTESLQLLVARVNTDVSDVYAIGYRAHLLSGRDATLEPSLLYGHFRSEADAVLYLCGFFKVRADMFSPDVLMELNALIRRYSQTSLF